MTDDRHCAVCGTADAETWTPAVLLKPIHLRTSLLNDAQVPPIPAGLYWLCPVCEAWQPDARTAPLPGHVLATVDAMAVLIEHPLTRRQFHTDQVGAYRHFARQLQRVHGE